MKPGQRLQPVDRGELVAAQVELYERVHPEERGRVQAGVRLRVRVRVRVRVRFASAPHASSRREP